MGDSGDLTFSERINKLIKHHSDKPYLTTLRDGIFTALVTIIVILLLSIIYQLAAGSIFNLVSRDFASSLLKSFTIALVAQIIYEYIGINGIICESTFRHTRGYSLEKYQSRRQLLVYETVDKLINTNPGDTDKIQSNKNALLGMIKDRNNLLLTKSLDDAVVEYILLNGVSEFTTTEIKQLIGTKKIINPDAYMNAYNAYISKYSPPPGCYYHKMKDKYYMSKLNLEYNISKVN